MTRPSVLLQQLLPQRLMGRLVYRLARCNRRWISRPLMTWFARRHEVDLKEAEHSRLENYASLNEFLPVASSRERAPLPAANAR